LCVSQVMTRLSISLYNHNTIGDALVLMREKKSTGLPVLNEQGRLLGLVTKEQVLEKGLEGFDAEQKAVDYLTTRYIPLKEDALVEDVWNLPFELFPVLNSKEEIVGVVTRYSLGQALFEHDQLRRQELEAVFDSTHNGIIAINKQGIITSLNPAGEAPTRSSRKEAVGRFLNDVIIPTGLLEVVRTGIPEFGIRFRVGKRQYITNRTPIIKDGEVIGAVGVFQDVSELESVLKELQGVKQLNDELRTIVDSSDNGIIICDGAGNILRCNQAVERILGILREDLNGKPFRDLVDRGVFAKNIIHLVKQEKDPVSVLERPYNTEHNLVVTGNPVYDDDGEITKVVINIRDISELLKLREALEETKLLSEKYQSEIAQMRTGESKEVELIARSSGMKNALDLAWRVSQVDSPVVLIGERGVGKEELARLVHNHSFRKSKPFYKINCGSVPEHLLETELFGYKNTSTPPSGKTPKSGLLELANQGTILLEEVGRVPLRLQMRLLRLLKDQETAYDSQESERWDVRLIVTSDRSLKELVDTGLFLEELFFTLNVVPIMIPPLRERKEDILPLLNRYIAENNKRYNLDKELSPEAVKLLLNYKWPGNLREMTNILERLVVTAKTKFIHGEEVATALNQREQVHARPVSVSGVIPLKAAIDELEQQLVTMAMEQCGTTVKAAEALGVNQSTVVRKLQKLKEQEVVRWKQ